MNIPDMMETLVSARHDTQAAYEVYKACKEKEEGLRDGLMVKLSQSGLKSAKDANSGTMASISTRESIKVIDETKVLRWIKENPSLELKPYVGLNKLAFTPVAKQWLEKTGEIIPGTMLDEVDYIIIKEKKKENK